MVDRDGFDRKGKGQEIIKAMFGEMKDDSRPAFKDMGNLTSDYLFGEIWSRPGLALRDRSLVTVSILVATGKEKQLRTHLIGALANGLTPDELKESIMHAAHYSGWPCGVNGLRVLQELAEEQNLDFSSDN
jgi:4-carboxymuconolactone decarboxylase